MSALKDDEIDMALRAIPATSRHAEAPVDDGVLLAFRDGKLSPEASEAVERRLARDPDARALLLELSGEVSPAEVDAVVNRLAGAPTPVSNVIPLRPRRKAVLMGSALSAIAAGLLAVVIAWPARETGRYQLELEGGEAPTRGSTQAQRLVLGAEGRLTVRLRAEVATDAPRAIGVFTEVDGKLVRVKSAQVAARNGSFEVRFDGAEWLGAAGLHRVWIHVGDDDAAVNAVEGRVQREVVDSGHGWWALDVERRAE